MQALYENYSSAVRSNRTTVGVCQGCLLSPILFNLFLEKIMRATLHNHHTSISISGRPMCSLRFTDDIDLLGGSNGESQDLTNRIEDRGTAHGMEVGTDKNKIMISSTRTFSANSNMTGKKLEEVTSFKYPRATVCNNVTYSAEVRIRIASAMAAMARLHRIWRCNTISFARKFKLYKSCHLHPLRL